MGLPPLDLGQQFLILMLGTVVKPGDNISVDYGQLLTFLLRKIISEWRIAHKEMRNKGRERDVNFSVNRRINPGK